MSELIVFAFSNDKGASGMGEAIKKLQREQLVTLDDAAIVVRNHNGKVKVKQAVNLAGAGTVGRAFWGMLIGLLFWIPWLGVAIGAVTCAISAKLTDYGIKDDFIHEIGETIEPGGSALFLLISKWTEDKVLDELSRFNPKVVRTSLSKKKVNLKRPLVPENFQDSVRGSFPEKRKYKISIYLVECSSRLLRGMSAPYLQFCKKGYICKE